MNEIADKITISLGKSNKPLSFRVKQHIRKPRPEPSRREQQRDQAMQIALLNKDTTMQNESVKKAIKTIKKAAKAVKKVGGKIVKVMGTRPSPEDVMITGRYESYELEEGAPDIGQNLKGMPRRAARKAAYASKNWGKGKITTAIYQKASDRLTRKLGSQARRVGGKLDRATKDFAQRMGMKEAVKADEFKVGDRVRLGMAQRGGAGVRGTITKIEGNTVFVQSDFKEKYGPQTYKGQVKNLMKESHDISEASLKKALMTGDKVARQKASYRQSQLDAIRFNAANRGYSEYHPDYTKPEKPVEGIRSSDQLAASAKANYKFFKPSTYNKKVARAEKLRNMKQQPAWNRDEKKAKKDRKARIQKAFSALGKFNESLELDEGKGGRSGFTNLMARQVSRVRRAGGREDVQREIGNYTKAEAESGESKMTYQARRAFSDANIEARVKERDALKAKKQEAIKKAMDMRRPKPPGFQPEMNLQLDTGEYIIDDPTFFPSHLKGFADRFLSPKQATQGVNKYTGNGFYPGS